MLSAKSFFLLNQLKVLTVTDLIETFKSGTLFSKVSISERRGSGVYFAKWELAKTQQNKSLPA